jgi:hypothetical protein
LSAERASAGSPPCVQNADDPLQQSCAQNLRSGKMRIAAEPRKGGDSCNFATKIILPRCARPERSAPPGPNAANASLKSW